MSKLRSVRRLTALALGLGCALSAVGCQADGDGGLIIGMHAYGRNVETTLGKVDQAHMSPTRSVEKNFRENSMSLGQSSTSFRRQGG
ncbi:MAG: hypothetical protein KDD64_00960 [Bdellovibrionales bacterium]|nr:hypothetical protein [Bdellovibrionales bacterium]